MGEADSDGVAGSAVLPLPGPLLSQAARASSSAIALERAGAASLSG